MKPISAICPGISVTKSLITSRQSTSLPASKKFGFNSTNKVVLLIAMLIFSSAANAQFCPQNFDGSTAPALPSGWTASVLPVAVSPWATSTASAFTTPNAAFAANPALVSDNLLTSPGTAVTAVNSSFYFRHSYKTESNFDGGVLEISIDGGAFADIILAGGTFSVGGYNATISSAFMSPIAGRMAWSGNAGGFITTGVTLPLAALGHTVAVRWRATSDSSVGGTGWYVDSILCGAAPPPPTPLPSPWNLAAAYPIPIDGQAMTTIGNVLYSFGGFTTNNAVTRSAYLFGNNRWRAIADLPLYRGSGARAFASVVSDGRYAYIFGGINSSLIVLPENYRYDPVTGCYTRIAAAPTATVGSATVYLDGKIYKIGGQTANGGATSIDSVEVYQIDRDEWSSAMPDPYPVAISSASAFVSGQFIYVAGGIARGNGTSGETAKTYRYDPVADVWDDVAFSDLPQPRARSASAFLGSTFVMAGGRGLSDAAESAVEWNAVANIWTNLPDLRLPRDSSSGGVLNGHFYAVGGSPTIAIAPTTQTQTLDGIFYNGFELYE